jgi:hypothetical protein
VKWNACKYGVHQQVTLGPMCMVRFAASVK